MGRKGVFWFLMTFMITIEGTSATNIALGQPAVHTQSLDFAGYMWEAGLAVDNGKPPFPDNNYENSKSCSCSIADGENTWTVYLDQPYVLQNVIVHGRSDIETQLENFRLYIRQDQSSPEVQVYDNNGVPYDNGYFDIPISSSMAVTEVTIKRNPGPLTLCEVEIYAVEPTTSTSTETPTTTTTEATTTTTEATTTVTTTTTTAAGPSSSIVSRFKPTNQSFTLDYFFLWTSDKAVDGDYRTNNPNSDGSCATTQQPTNNEWNVNLLTQFLVDKIDIYSRSDGQDQISGFQVYGQVDDGFPKFLIHTDTLMPGTSFFTVYVVPATNLKYITIRRDSILTLCEVDVFRAAPPSTEATTTTPPTEGTTTTAPRVSVAFNKPASQLEDLNYGFVWFASYAVDGCYERTDPNNVQCCSTSMGTVNNYWTVDLQTAVFVDLIVIYGRADQDDQLPGFQMFSIEFDGDAEDLVYDSTDVPYGSGIYSIPIDPPKLMKKVTIRRDGIISLCEVDVFEAINVPTEPTSTSQTTSKTPATTTDLTIDTSSEGDTTTTGVTVEQITTVVTSTDTPTAPPTASPTSAPPTSAPDTSTASTSTEPTTQPTTPQPTNVALNMFANQTDTLDFSGYLWEAGLAVDGCKPPFAGDDYENSQCCSGSFAAENTWTVYLIGHYVISRIIVIGRSDQSTQLENFQVYIQENSMSPEILVYDNSGVPYGSGYFEFPVVSMVPVSQVIVKRLTGPLIMCEVEVYGVPFVDTPSTTVPVDITTTAVVTTTTALPETTTTAVDTTATGIETSTGDTQTTTDASATTTISSSTSLMTSTSTEQSSSTDLTSSDNTSPPSVATSTSGSSATSLPSATTQSDTTSPDQGSTTTVADTTTTQGTSGGGINVAPGQMATHRNDLTYNGFAWTADKAIDGCYDRDNPDVSRCCSCSEQVDPGDNFWQLTFSQTQALMKINIFGRGDFGSQLDDFVLYINDTTGSPVFDASGIPFTDGIYEIVLEPEEHANAIIVKRPTGPEYTYISLCEVEAISACDDGFFGNQCENKCGKCLDKEACYKITGTCPNKCAAGYQGTQCFTECINGTYGENCQEFCGNCDAGAFCDTIIGSCPLGCAPGWKGELCKTPCDVGEYGANCQNPCGQCAPSTTCNALTGICESGCAPGWDPQDSMCYTECADGYYGAGCTTPCGNCLMDGICDNENGTCPGQCDPGFQGELCIQPCFDGNYGIDCLEICGRCQGAAACSIFNGDCPGGLCDPGFIGTNCKQDCPDGFYGFGCSQRCGNCSQGASCNKENGTCPGQCDPGWQGPLCNQGCSDGSYGVDCMETCGPCLGGAACDDSTGDCPSGLCAAGFTSSNCKQECPAGTYGFQCTGTCSNCFADEPCYHVNGTCLNGCAAGFQGPLCDSACSPGTFGTNCQSPCGQCESGADCDSVNGACPGNCAAGWEGTNCDQAIPSTTTVPTTTQGESTTQTAPTTTQETTQPTTSSTTQVPTTLTTQVTTERSTINTGQTSTLSPTTSSTPSTTQGPTADSTTTTTATSLSTTTQADVTTDSGTSSSTHSATPTDRPTESTSVNPPTVSTQSSTESPTQGSTAGPTQGSTAGPTQGSTAGPTQGSTAGPTQGSTAGPTQGSTAGPTQGSTAGPTQGSTGGSSSGSSTGTTMDPWNTAPSFTMSGILVFVSGVTFLFLCSVM